ncbi:hypothetical protein QVD17_06495 [Tagetes erecta]|uniref:Uncharacterized protein n=1 Tax=Tagetes erecta TaxID=13708 RepID=A0AAD8LKR8_TARER|nr:hypothetical protein QVD17_06495 [Tagetes erecta]
MIFGFGCFGKKLEDIVPSSHNYDIKDGFGDGKDLVVTVMFDMGKEEICALKDIGSKLKSAMRLSRSLLRKKKRKKVLFEIRKSQELENRTLRRDNFPKKEFEENQLPKFTSLEDQGDATYDVDFVKALKESSYVEGALNLSKYAEIRCNAYILAISQY